MADEKTTYDEIPYSDSCFHVSHPDHLAALAAVHGVPAPAVETCRVLELGCARGGNLLPMALELPEASFVGIDLSEKQIEDARETAARLGLTNVDLRAMSLTGVDASFGTFDYIVCHGVYSWVPEAVREKILAICSENLAPSGLAYVSYNTFPGWHERGLVRELMLYHTRNATSPTERLGRAWSIPGELAAVLPNPSSPYGNILRTEGEILREVTGTYLFHEFLEEVNQPMYVREFLSRAAKSGLEFVAEAMTPGLLAGLPPAAREAVSRWADDVVSREQYLDFVCNRPFRRTILRRAGGPPATGLSTDVVTGLQVSTAVMPASDAPILADDAPVEFTRPGNAGSVTTNNPVVKAALETLYVERPRALDFEALWAKVRARLVEAGRKLPADEEEGRKSLRTSLLSLFLSDLVEFHVRPPRPFPHVSARPLGSPLARLQAAHAERVTSLRRRAVDLAEFDRAVLLQLDGSRDHDAVLDGVVAEVLSGDFDLSQEGQPIREPEAIRALFEKEIEPALRRLAADALLAG